jgi:hypothetical protein
MSIEDPQEGMIVEKVGRTTNHTTGKIVGRELVPIRISVSAPTYNFNANIWFHGVFIVHGENDVFSDQGDSGSLITTRNSNGNMASIGLLFAGGPDSRAPGNLRTLILPLRPILERLGVELVGGLNVPSNP